MNTRMLAAPALALSALSLGACANNYTIEGAAVGAAAGAAVAAITDEDIATYAAVGAAAGAIAGYFTDKDDDCDGFYDDNRRGYLDDDCRYVEGYRQYWRN